MKNPKPVLPGRLKNRQDFLAAEKGARSFGQAFVLQSHRRMNADHEGGKVEAARFGITVTKKIGNAVVRNRIRRRLREAIRLNAACLAQSGNDYVLIAREASLKMGFPMLVDELLAGIERVNKKNHSKNRHTHPISTSSRQNRIAGHRKSSKQKNTSVTTHSTGS